jgi:hypothetical protein
MYQSRDATDAVDLITTAENAKEKFAHYAQENSLKQCTAAPKEYKCINCMVYKKHHPTTQIDTAHSSLDKKCPA